MRTHEIWNEHVLNELSNKNGLKRSIFKSSLKVLDHIAPSDNYNKILRYMFFKINKINYGIPHLIPTTLIDLFSVQNNIPKMKSIYDIFRENDIKYIIKEPHIDVLEPFIIKEIPKILNKNHFIFIKINALDRIGHKYGPFSMFIQRRVKYYDNLIKYLMKTLNDKAILILMSDHGMDPVKYNFDLTSYLLKNGFVYGKHYIGFIGATYASFWYKNKKCEYQIKDTINKINIGKFLNLEDKKNLGIEWIGKEYGEDIYAIKSKNVIFPEFYHIREPPKGMHGYAFSNYDRPIFMLKNDVLKLKYKDNVNFIDIMPTILSLMDVSIPSYIEGKSLI